MDEDRVVELLSRLGKAVDTERPAVRELRKLGSRFPDLLLNKYRTSRRWRERVACAYYLISDSRESQAALQLGLEAIFDKSKKVRYRACMLLAYSQNLDALPKLREALLLFSDSESRADFLAAIDAIENRNHNYFLDRKHTGRILFQIYERSRTQSKRGVEG